MNSIMECKGSCFLWKKPRLEGQKMIKEVKCNQNLQSMVHIDYIASKKSLQHAYWQNYEHLYGKNIT